MSLFENGDAFQCTIAQTQDVAFCPGLLVHFRQSSVLGRSASINRPCFTSPFSLALQGQVVSLDGHFISVFYSVRNDSLSPFQATLLHKERGEGNRRTEKETEMQMSGTQPEKLNKCFSPTETYNLRKQIYWILNIYSEPTKREREGERGGERLILAQKCQPSELRP